MDFYVVSLLPFKGNIDLNLIACEDKVVIPSNLQSYLLHWYHTYILHPGMDRTKAIICQYFYWTNIINTFQREVSNCDTCQRTKRSNKKYSKLPAKLAEEIPWNKIFVDLIGPYTIKINGKKKNLHPKSITMIDPVTGWFEIAQYDDKIDIFIANLVETKWLSRYPIPIEITYDQGSEFIGHEFR